MFAPLWHGEPLSPGDVRRQKRTHPCREHALMRRLGPGDWTYIAISPCQRFAKIGRSWNPVIRVREATKWRKVEGLLGIDRVYLTRVYEGGLELERECHAFLAPDRVASEWFRVGARFRILVARLDRELGSIVRSGGRRPSHRIANPSK